MIFEIIDQELIVGGRKLNFEEEKIISSIWDPALHSNYYQIFNIQYSKIQFSIFKSQYSKFDIEHSRISTQYLSTQDSNSNSSSKINIE